MANIHGKESVVLVKAFDLSSYFTNATPSNSVEAAETTTFGNNDKTYIAGLRDGTLALSGLFDGAADAVDEELSAILGDNAGHVVTVGYNGTTVGNTARLLTGKLTAYDVNAPVADVVDVSATYQADGGIHRGVFLHALEAETETGSEASVNNGASTAYGALGNLHVTSVAGGGTWTFKAQDSANNSDWADLITFTNVTAPTSQASEVTGTVDQYTRADWSVSGGTGNSITFAMALARYHT